MRFICFIALLLSFSANSFCQNPKPFLPEIMAQFPNVRDITILADGSELYFSVQSYKKEYTAIVRLQKSENTWKQPTIASFSGQYTDLEPALSHDGLKLYFSSNRPKKETSKIADFDIWYVERKSKDNEWSNAINLGYVINTNKNEFYPSLAANGNIYFTSSYESSKGKEDIFLSEYIDGKFQKPLSLSGSINTDGWEYNAFIAPDELYIIFSSTKHENNVGGGDLYISFKDKDNNWLPAENLGISINSPKLDFCPFVDTKNNMLYFSSQKTIINKAFVLRHDLKELQKVFNTIPNGLCRIYYIPFESINK
ncbi:MAG: hypothetical protein PF517_17860 [Salinivirgaceae bacterium]|jgi:hypothetical protein|nr:hypothetical protein [Salinivirgaceae bacterium]